MGNYFHAIKTYVYACVASGTVVTQHNLLAAAVIGGIGHPAFYFLHLYLFGQAWQSLLLSMLAGVICAALLIRDKWPPWLKKYFAWYWHGMLIFEFSFLITFIALNNGFVDVWPVWELSMLFMLAMFIPNWLMLLFSLTIGLSLATVAHAFTPTAQPVSLQINTYWYFSVFVFSIVAGLIFSYSNLKGLLAQERSKTLKALAGSIAHEIRNPLSEVSLGLEGIGGMLPVCADHMSAEQLARLSRFISLGQGAIERGNQMIAMILASISSNTVDRSQFEYLSAASITKKAVDEYSFTGRGARNVQSNLRDRVSVNVEKDFIFHGNETAYVFVLFNLIKNALYYFGQKTEATLVLTIDDWKVTVRDTGPGIPQEVLPHLFESFMTSGKAEGTGLGLSYCKRTMQGFGGDIRCESVVGEFTEFTLSFPVLSEAELQAWKLAEMEKAAALQAQAMAPILPVARNKLEGKTVILAEDYEDSREMVSDLLQGWGMTVLEAGDGKQVLAHLHSNPSVDLILMDMAMPFLNGVQTTLAIRAKDWVHQGVVILGFTGYCDESDIKTAMEAGMNDFIVKSGSMKLLRENLVEVVTAMEESKKLSAI